MQTKQKPTEIAIIFWLLCLYTIAYMGLMIYDFAMKEAFSMPPGMMAVYFAIVSAYAADKEIRRWMGKEQQSRKGSIFVYIWMVLFKNIPNRTNQL